MCRVGLTEDDPIQSGGICPGQKWSGKVFRGVETLGFRSKSWTAPDFME
jgi:hypothetical protein